jgi:putative transposase
VENDSRTLGPAQAVGGVDVGTLEALIRQRVRETIEAVVVAELKTALGAARSDCAGASRRGHRHGTRSRTLTTSVGPTALTLPRARLRTASGTTEWQSTTLPRYQRRTVRVDEAILGVYLSGANTGRIRGAWPHCCAAARCRRMPSRGWSAA